jgi:hypothetical protein
MTEPRRHDKWSIERAAHAALLTGLGFTPAEIAANPRIDSTALAVNKQLSRLGILSAKAGHEIRLTPAARSAFEAAGRARQMTAEGIAREALVALARDKTLLDNVLDDGVTS